MKKSIESLNINQNLFPNKVFVSLCVVIQFYSYL